MSDDCNVTSANQTINDPSPLMSLAPFRLLPNRLLFSSPSNCFLASCAAQTAAVNTASDCGVTSCDAAWYDISARRHVMRCGAETLGVWRRAVSDTPEHSEAPDATAALHKHSVTLSRRDDLKPCIHADWVVVVP